MDDSIRFHAADDRKMSYHLPPAAISCGRKRWDRIRSSSLPLVPARPSSTQNRRPRSQAEISSPFFARLNGRKQLFVRDLTHPGSPDQQLTTATSTWNLEEIAISPDDSIIVSATKDKGEPGFTGCAASINWSLFPVGEARYPAISPDGRWLAFSSFQSGYWNLSLRDLSTRRGAPSDHCGLQSNCACLAARLQNAALQQRLWARAGFYRYLQATLFALIFVRRGNHDETPTIR